MTENVKAAIKAQTDQLETVTTALTRFNATEAGLADLHERYDDATFNVDEPKGMKLAKEARAEIRKPRFNVEKLRKAAKAPILELGRMIDADAKSLTTELLSLETPIDDQIKTAERIEAARIKKIDELMGEIDGVLNVVDRYNPSAEKIGQFINDVCDIDITAEVYMEFEADALGKQNRVLVELRKRMTAKEQEEADAAELETLRREKAEREEADRKEAARKQAVADAAQAAVDEGQGNGSKGDAGSIFDDEPQPLSIEEQLDRDADEPTTADEANAESGVGRDAGVSPLAAATIEPGPQVDVMDPEPAFYPGRAGIVHAVAGAFDVSEAVASSWIERIESAAVKQSDAEAMPF